MQFELNAQQRTLQGSGASRRLRRAGRCRASSMADRRPLAIELDHNSLSTQLEESLPLLPSSTSSSTARRNRSCCATPRCTPTNRWSCVSISSGRRHPRTAHQGAAPLRQRRHRPGVKLSWRPGQPHPDRSRHSCLAKDLPEFIEVDVGALHGSAKTFHVSQLKLPGRQGRRPARFR